MDERTAVDMLGPEGAITVLDSFDPEPELGDSPVLVIVDASRAVWLWLPTHPETKYGITRTHAEGCYLPEDAPQRAGIRAVFARHRADFPGCSCTAALEQRYQEA